MSLVLSVTTTYFREKAISVEEEFKMTYCETKLAMIKFHGHEGVNKYPASVTCLTSALVYIFVCKRYFFFMFTHFVHK